jgi:hypothetical protein
MTLSAAALAALLVQTAPAAADASPAEAWWERLEALCGQAFEGELHRAPEGDDSLSGQRLVMHVRACEPDRIRIPFVVGDNLSRTWVLTRHANGAIELRHDHRYEDGSEEAATQYGGVTVSPGSDFGQIFPGDHVTTARLPTSWQNVWLMEIHPGERFVYHVRRVGTQRAFHAEFDLTSPVEAPDAPWGWED